MKFVFSLFFWLLSASVSAQSANAVCQFYVDDEAVLHIKTESEEGFWPCMGFAHAQHRGFQMEFFRRAAEGRLSELYGFSKLETDIFLRLLNLPEVAKRLFSELEPKTLKLLESYAAGVNSAFESLPESEASKFRHFKIPPPHWTAHTTLSVLLLQSFFQSKRGFEMELRAEHLAERLPQSDVDAYRNDFDRPWFTSVVKPYELPQAAILNFKKSGTPEPHLPPQVAEGLIKKFDIPGLRIHGSNNFVLAPKRTKSGHALLGNDPHLEINDPPYFFWMNIQTPTQNIIGATVAGVPGFPFGMNTKMAWGLTNSFFDVTDLVLTSQQNLKLKSARPTIHVKIGPFQFPFFFKNLQWTDEEDSRPILPVEIDRMSSKDVLVLEWSGFKISGKSITPLFELPFSDSVQSFDKRLMHTEVPSWHFVYADTKGNIGFRTSGLLPKLHEMNSFGVKSDRKNFSEMLSPLEAPSLSNPERGFIVTANNPPWPKYYRYSAGNAFEPAFRAHRIEELVHSQDKWDLENAKKLQCDFKAPDADFILPLMSEILKKNESLTEKETRLLNSLTDALPLYFTRECRLCALYTLWMEKLRDEMKMDEINIYYWLSRQNKSRDEISDILQKTFRTAIRTLEKTTGLEPQWADVHRNRFLKLGETTRDIEDSAPAQGAYHSVSLGQSKWNDADSVFDVSYVPASRFLVELSSPPRAVFVTPSLNISTLSVSSFSKDPMTEAWTNCDYRPLSFGFSPPDNVQSLRTVTINLKKTQ